MLKDYLFDDSLGIVGWALGLRIYARCMPHKYPIGDIVPLVRTLLGSVLLELNYNAINNQLS